MNIKKNIKYVISEQEISHISDIEMSMDIINVCVKFLNEKKDDLDDQICYIKDDRDKINSKLKKKKFEYDYINSFLKDFKRV